MPEPHDSPMRPVFLSVQAWVRLNYGPHRRIRQLRLRLVLDDGEEVVLPVPIGWAGRDEPPPPEPRREAEVSYRHSPDFRSVNWFGEVYSFTEPQALAVRLLWENWERGTPDVSDKVLVRAAGSESTRLADSFRDSPAWGTFIVEGGTRGTHRLADPGA